MCFPGVTFNPGIDGVILAPTSIAAHQNPPGSYTWKRLGKPLNMEKTLAENGMEELVMMIWFDVWSVTWWMIPWLKGDSSSQPPFFGGSMMMMLKKMGVYLDHPI